MGRGKLLTAVAVLLLVGLLLWSTLASQRVECSVTVEFQDQRNTATASAASEADAIREAQTTACGPITRGMNDVIACGNRPPISRQCRGL